MGGLDLLGLADARADMLLEEVLASQPVVDP